MKAFLVALVVGIVASFVAVSSGATPGNFAYGKIAPYILAVGFAGGVSLAWFPLELLFRRIDRKKFDGTLILSATPFCLGLVAVGFWAIGRYSDEAKFGRLLSGGLSSKEQLAIVTRYQSHFAERWTCSRLASTDAVGPIAIDNPEVLRAIAIDSRLDEFIQFLGPNPSTPDDILESYAKDRIEHFTCEKIRNGSFARNEAEPVATANGPKRPWLISNVRQK